MDGWFGVIGIAVTALGGVIATVATRRTAKDTTAVTGFVSLNAALEHRVERLEAAETTRLQEDRRKAELAVKHRVWDGQIYDEARAAGWTVTPPPPLD